MEKLIILDFTTGDVDIHPTEYGEVPDKPDIDAVLKELGHRPDDCLWMISDGQITFHKEILSK